MSSVPRRMMTYIVPLGAAGLLALAACSSSPGATAGTTSTVSPQVAAIKNAVTQMQDAQTTWTGPTTGPVASPGKRIVYLSGQESNSLDAAYGQYLQQAARKIGWTVTIIDGQGTPTGWLAGMNQAIALHPAGIIIFADATSLQQPIQVAHADHIPVVGLHASQTTGPGYGLYTNIQEDAAAIGRAEADYAIADSNGTAHVIIVTHNEYGIAVIKSDAMKAELAKCKGCKLLSYVNFPAADADTRMAQIATSWVSTYGDSFYAMTVGDNDWDFAVPALSAGGASSGSLKLIGSDGTATAYQRIRANSFEVATVPEPAQEEADYALYQMNRALHGLPADTWYPPIYLVTHSNVNAEGGAQDQFDPASNYESIFTSLLTAGHS